MRMIKTNEEGLRNFLGSLIKNNTRVVAPVKENKMILFKEISNAADILLTDEITYKSPKEFLLPQVEKILEFSSDETVKTGEEGQKTIIFGVRPCDLAALKVMNTIFTDGKYVDSYYYNHLNDTVFIGFGCKEMKPGCFCDERGILKDYSSDCDIFVKPDANGYLIYIVSEKGAKLAEIAGIGEGETCLDMPESSSYSGQSGKLKINASEKELFGKVDWDKLAERCIGCGTCSFICPTCHCFEFKDIKEGNKTIRYRYWDNCMNSRFTLHASGHNPRPLKVNRLRQRILHKYLYIRDNTGYIACTGCGRCVRSCPAGVNIKTAVKSILEDVK
jgi:sulfhydrogenase subunit beta (sulfur reductase)